jgi:hypothetical protein
MWLESSLICEKLLTLSLMTYYYLIFDLVGRPVKKGSVLILRKNRPVQQIKESNKIDQAVQFVFARDINY